MSEPRTRRILVTGAADPVGAACVRAFHREGAQVLAADRPAGAATLAGLERELGIATTTIERTDEATIADLVSSARERLDGLDGLVVAGTGTAVESVPLVDLEQTAWQAGIDGGLVATYVICREAARAMEAAGEGGAIVVVGTLASKRPSDGLRSVSEAATWMLARVMAAELADSGVRVNCVAAATAGEGGGDAVGDAAAAVSYLLSDGAGSTTGAILHPDAGVASLAAGG